MGASSNRLSINQGVIGRELEEKRKTYTERSLAAGASASEHVHVAPLLVAGKADLNIDVCGQPDSGST